jgi:hypothetical protein
MKKMVSIGLVLGVLMFSVSADAKSYKNCSDLNKKYPYGVATSQKAAAKQKNKPAISAKIYKANIKMDRDKDGTACEK